LCSNREAGQFEADESGDKPRASYFSHPTAAAVEECPVVFVAVTVATKKQ